MSATRNRAAHEDPEQNEADGARLQPDPKNVVVGLVMPERPPRNVGEAYDHVEQLAEADPQQRVRVNCGPHVELFDVAVQIRARVSGVRLVEGLDGAGWLSEQSRVVPEDRNVNGHSDDQR